MSIAQKRGQGGPRFNEDIVNAAMMIAGALLILFFLLAIRMYFDQREGKTLPLEPTRSPRGVLNRMFNENLKRTLTDE